MENDVSENVESSVEDSSQSSEVSEGTNEVSNSCDVGSSSDSLGDVSPETSNDVVSTVSDRTDEHSEVAEDQKQEETKEDEIVEEAPKVDEVIEDGRPSSTVIQVSPVEGSDTDYSVTELDVESLNIMSQSYVDSMLAVTPTSNDYYTFMDSNVKEYFSGIMANYPFNKYKAYHLRHWVYQSQYSSYYDDYYYLFYDTPDNDCVEVYKPYNSNSFQVTWGNAEILNSTITYGSEVGMSDFREGVSYVSWFSALCVLGCVCVLYIVHAIFKHLAS